ncbi:MAG: hypothetical protein P9L89_02390 [Candidatus Celaenobacter polaris]|nr:hypothetical protein [Candidatus Celaenobacter polaris]
MLESYLWFDGKNIRVGFTEKDRKFVKKTFIGLKEAIKFLSVYFHLEKDFPSIRSILTPSREEYDLLVKELLKVNIETPSNPSRIAQPQRTDLVLLAPSAYSTDSIYRYSAKEYKRLLFHEVTHMFEEYLSPNIELTPRWWSEGLAVYLSEQWKYEDDFRAPVLEGFRSKNIPKIKEIQKDVKLSYQWGWTIVKYIDYCYGRKTILNIVANCVDGDVFKIIGETIRNFERGWKKYLQNEKEIFNFA